MALVAHWSMDDVLSSLIPDVAGSNDLTATASPPIIEGRINRAREFNDPSAHLAQWAHNADATVELRNVFVGGGDYTVSLWVRVPTGATGASTQYVLQILSRTAPDDYASVFFNAFDSSLYFYSSGWNSSLGLAVVPFDQWTHVVFRKTGLFLDVFLNGVQVEDDAQFEPDFTGFPDDATHILLAGSENQIEAAPDDFGQCFCGDLDDVRIYDQALDDTQIGRLAAGNEAEGVLPWDTALDLAQHLASLSPIATTTLTMDVNLFTGPERAVRTEVPHLAVFIQNMTGPPPVPYLNNLEDFFRFQVQALVRSNPGHYDAGEALARAVIHQLHREKPTGYVSVLSQQTGPTYLGEDENRVHRWVLNLEAWRKG